MTEEVLQRNLVHYMLGLLSCNLAIHGCVPSLLSLLLLQQLSVRLKNDQSEAHKLMHKPCKACKALQQVL